MRYFGDDVGAAAHAALRVAIAFEGHVTCFPQLTQQRIDTVPTKIAALLEIVDQYLPVVRPRQQVGEQAPCGPGETGVLHRGLVDDDEAMAARGAADGLAHGPSAPLMITATWFDPRYEPALTAQSTRRLRRPPHFQV